MNTLFSDTKVAFALKNDRQLRRAYWLFNMIKNPTLVKVGTTLTNVALKLNLPVDGLIRTTVFDHFCGGISENDCLQVVDNMYDNGKVSSVLDYSVEGKESEEQFDAALEMVLKTIVFAKERNAIPFAVFKPTGLGRFALYQKITEKNTLTESEKEEWNRVVARFHFLCKKAHDLNVSVLIDGEESWMQDAADDLVLEMMRTYNTEKTVVYNTLQLYRWDRLDYLKELHKTATNEGFYIGMKLVRGAYMEKENDRAQEKGYKSPICESKKTTDDNFNKTLKYMLNHTDKMALFIGTHNENSSYLAMDIMKENNLEANNKSVFFGQLFGMSDNISYNLANQGYNVAKYLPFGPVKDVMPYLIRRAQENTSVAGQTNRELDLISAEIKRRKSAN